MPTNIVTIGNQTTLSAVAFNSEILATASGFSLQARRRLNPACGSPGIRTDP